MAKTTVKGRILSVPEVKEVNWNDKKTGEKKSSQVVNFRFAEEVDKGNYTDRQYCFVSKWNLTDKQIELFKSLDEGTGIKLEGDLYFKSIKPTEENKYSDYKTIVELNANSYQITFPVYKEDYKKTNDANKAPKQETPKQEAPTQDTPSKSR